MKYPIDVATSPSIIRNQKNIETFFDEMYSKAVKKYDTKSNTNTKKKLDFSPGSSESLFVQNILDFLKEQALRSKIDIVQKILMLNACTRYCEYFVDLLIKDNQRDKVWISAFFTSLRNEVFKFVVKSDMIYDIMFDDIEGDE